MRITVKARIALSMGVLIRTSDLGIKSPAEEDARECDKQKPPATGRYRCCTILQPSAATETVLYAQPYARDAITVTCDPQIHRDGSVSRLRGDDA
jgi:hypothetical protein